MEPRTFSYVAEACGGTVVQGTPDFLVERVCTDSRLIRAGDLFIALAGERFDGHGFAEEASEKGAAGIVVDVGRWPIPGVGCPVIAVDGTRGALGRLASRYRTGFNLPVVAVAGSNGKTTTKELLAAVLRQKYSVLWSQASYNNDIGVPLTLLNLNRSHSVAVVEVGSNHPGELAPLMRMVQPEYGVLTNIGREHLEYFGDMEGVAREEGWVAELLPAHGTFFLNGDSPGARSVESRTRASIVRVGMEADNDWRGEVLGTDLSGLSFRVSTVERGFNGEYRLNLLGRHQVTNALLAVAVAEALGLSPAEVRRGLAACRGAKMRLEVREKEGVLVLDDTYNANQDSVIAALDTLKELPCDGRRVAVLGDMAELGERSAEAHAAVGRHAALVGVDRLLTVGRWAGTMAEEARAAGLRDVIEFPDVSGVAACLASWVRSGDAVLLKASRATGFERVSAEWLVV